LSGVEHSFRSCVLIVAHHEFEELRAAKGVETQKPLPQGVVAGNLVQERAPDVTFNVQVDRSHQDDV
jgi:hypothetical protein